MDKSYTYSEKITDYNFSTGTVSFSYALPTVEFEMEDETE